MKRYKRSIAVIPATVDFLEKAAKPSFVPAIFPCSIDKKRRVTLSDYDRPQPRDNIHTPRDPAAAPPCPPVLSTKVTVDCGRFWVVRYEIGLSLIHI